MLACRPGRGPDGGAPGGIPLSAEAGKPASTNWLNEFSRLGLCQSIDHFRGILNNWQNDVTVMSKGPAKKFSTGFRAPATSSRAAHSPVLRCHPWVHESLSISLR
ncbi:hypothetical protein PCLA_03f0524 [Pseudomonas citronellolis]|nr:hypothetical protein PCLA_03f0524 [Pseudomonas citronellolis]